MANRTLDSATIAQITSNKMQPCLLHEVNLTSGSRYNWSGSGSIVYNGNTYIGDGSILAITSVDETGNVKVNSMTVTYPGENPTLVSDILSGHQRKRKGKVWLAFLDSSRNIIAPYLLFEGHIDVVKTKHSSSNTTISISYESSYYSLSQKRGLYWNSETQELFISGDKGFEHVAGLQEWRGTWGSD